VRRVEDVERLLQVLSVLRAAEKAPVARAVLARKVTAYATSNATTEGVKKMIDRDLDALAGQGFQIDNVGNAGEEAAYVLREGEWRLPVALEPAERSLLVWAMAAAGASAAEELPSSLTPDLSSLLGNSPDGLDLVQAALAGGRALIVDKDGEEVEFAPGLLASRRGTWFVLGRFAGESLVKGPRLDRLAVQRLGPSLREPVDVGDPEQVLDPTAWPYHEDRQATLCCAAADLGLVASWFPRASVTEEDGEMVLRFSYRNEESLVDRVIGLAGAARVVAPASAVGSLRSHVEGVLG
jgi:predicted DNA-binding transcriptional regulator YafY